jgi:NADH dehydrogenase
MHRGYHVLAVPTWERKIRVLAIWLTAALFGRDIVSLASVQHPREAFVSYGELTSPPRSPEPTWSTASVRASAHTVDICSE